MIAQPILFGLLYLMTISALPPLLPPLRCARPCALHRCLQELEVFKNGQRVATRMPQAFLGEIALLYSCERTATISNGDEVASVLTLRAEHLQRMLDRVPDMREQIEATQRSRMVYSFMVLSGLFDQQSQTEEATAAQCAAIAECVTVRSVPAGTVLCEAHERNSEFLMLYQGTLSRTRHGSDKAVDGSGDGATTAEQTLSPGAYAGGIAMLRLDGTSERIVASAACLLLVADGSTGFFDLLREAPALHAELLLRAFGPKAPLSAFLECPRGFAALQAHQKQEFASESSEFWRDTSAFISASKAEDADAAALLSQATRLGEMYIREGAEREVNISSAVQKACLAKLTETPLDAALFDASRSEIYSLMRRDTLPRFLSGERFTRLIEGLGEALVMNDCEPPASLEAARAAYAALQGKAAGEPYSPYYSQSEPAS